MTLIQIFPLITNINVNYSFQLKLKMSKTRECKEKKRLNIRFKIYHSDYIGKKKCACHLCTYDISFEMINWSVSVILCTECCVIEIKSKWFMIVIVPLRGTSKYYHYYYVCVLLRQWRLWRVKCHVSESKSDIHVDMIFIYSFLSPMNY